ncbi:MAG: hypothetical protein IJ637_03190 [Prevotella sp.]|nr:hypothetical protein [Prevotella sp.]
MKKTYIIPTLEVMDVEAEQALLAVSGFDTLLDTEGGAGDGALSPEFDYEIEVLSPNY